MACLQGYKLTEQREGTCPKQLTIEHLENVCLVSKKYGA